MPVVTRQVPRAVLPVLLPVFLSVLAPVNLIAIAVLGFLCLAPAVVAQDTAEATQEPAAPLVRASPAPDSPAPGSPVTHAAVLPTPEVSVAASLQPTGTLTFGERFSLEVHTTFGPAAFLLPAVEAAYDMASPPSGYPHDWSDGVGAFGRNYGAILGVNTTSGLTHFTIAAIDREDPRYYPSLSTNFAARTVHALAFTLVDRSNSGHHTVAISNLAGATAGGFVGMAIYPGGFNDTTHAYQRAAFQMTSFVGHNLVAEFSPEIVHILHKLHFPDRVADSFLPADRRP
jgi:hypothetical protein